MPSGGNPRGESAGPVRVGVMRLASLGDLPLPQYMSDGASGVDLRAAVAETLVIDPGGYALVPTGLAVAIPAGYEGQVRPRSGLALRHGVLVLNAPGTIDSDYRGEIGIILANMGRIPFTVERGDRVAQLVVCRVERIEWEEAEALPATTRDAGGFGHTG